MRLTQLCNIIRQHLPYLFYNAKLFLTYKNVTDVNQLLRGDLTINIKEMHRSDSSRESTFDPPRTVPTLDTQKKTLTYKYVAGIRSYVLSIARFSL